MRVLGVENATPSIKSSNVSPATAPLVPSGTVTETPAVFSAALI